MGRRELWTGAAIAAGSVLYWLFQKRSRPATASFTPVKPQINQEIARTPVTYVPVMPLVKPSESTFFAEVLQKGGSLKVVEDRETPPHEDPQFGLDRDRNTDTVSVDDYLALPLEGAGVTHLNRVKWVDLEAPPAEGTPRATRFVFFRLKVLKTRDAAAVTAAIGGFMLLNGVDVVYHPRAKVWNPHTGQRTTYYPESAWSDSDQRELIVRFPVAVPVNAYKIRTSEQDVAFDPVEWRLEGSQNGVYWLPLDEQKIVPPHERGVWATFRMGLGV